ncbi:Acyl-CoA dehydrogenase [hydrothermal vent metagenome]|uniref:Acyl-CoA dehydrogenase n=1 Tax=hydrothermal vent metagenome TaxID=652676 RepID=A0A3B0TWL9_9ZZZZ
MSPLRPRTILETHEVLNQPSAPNDRDLWGDDQVLRQGVEREGGRTKDPAALGKALGEPRYQKAGRDANRFTPELVGFDRSGRRIDEVEFHPSYHQLMELGLGAGYAASSWERDGGEHVSHAAMVYLMNQVEPGVCCPMTMTYACFPVLAAQPDLPDDWHKLILGRRYDAASRPLAQKSAATIGMAMTEKQGGSDIRANSTIATPDGENYRLRGHKWFCSAPMCDAFLTLAQAKGGLTCFLVPRWTPDGQRNPIQLMRLKDKLGNRANATAEIEYHDAFASRLGEEGKGVKTILEMVHHTRLDTAMAPAGLMRAALSEALWWVGGRSAFQRRLIDQPLMRSVLADLALDWEGALALGLRVARSFGGKTDQDKAFGRISVALAKFLSNKRCPVVIYEAMECLGGSGYIEESPMPLLYREAPLNSIWEGSGNIICLDVLRTLEREPLAGEALRNELDAARGADQRYDGALDAFWARWPNGPHEAEARWFVERLAILLQASVLLRNAPNAVADGFMQTRVLEERGMISGSVGNIDVAAILQRLGASAQ